MTGCGAVCLSNNSGAGIALREAVVGRIVDNGTKDANNMGAAMATAAVDTILRYFDHSDYQPEDFDMIATGDLGREGYEIACELFKRCERELGGKYTDCGMLIYDMDQQDTHAGGSGCGCMGSVFGGYIFKRLQRGEINRVLLVATGALLNAQSVQQGLSIPSIAHAVCIERV